jgi:hypothetical protein
LRSWRGRRLREAGIVPSLFDGFASSVENYLFGGELRAFYYFGGPTGDGTFLARVAKDKQTTFAELQEAISSVLRDQYGTNLEEIFIATDRTEEERRDGLFDLIELLLGRVVSGALADEFAHFVNDAFARENQPFEVREARVRIAERPEETQILDGLAALAPTSEIAEDIRKAELAFFDPHDRRDEGLLLMARAYDAAKKSLGDPKKTFAALMSHSFVAPLDARPDALTAADSLFASISTIANEIIRHGGEKKVRIVSDEMKRHLFFAMASTVRLLYSLPEAR